MSPSTSHGSIPGIEREAGPPPPRYTNQLSTPQISLHACKGMINTYERICADDLRGMIGQDNRFLVLISNHEVAEVLARIVTVLFANCQEALVHIEWVRDADILYVLDPGSSSDTVHTCG